MAQIKGRRRNLSHLAPPGNLNHVNWPAQWSWLQAFEDELLVEAPCSCSRVCSPSSRSTQPCALTHRVPAKPRGSRARRRRKRRNRQMGSRQRAWHGDKTQFAALTRHGGQSSGCLFQIGSQRTARNSTWWCHLWRDTLRDSGREIGSGDVQQKDGTNPIRDFSTAEQSQAWTSRLSFSTRPFPRQLLRLRRPPGSSRFLRFFHILLFFVFPTSPPCRPVIEFDPARPSPRQHRASSSSLSPFASALRSPRLDQLAVARPPVAPWRTPPLPRTSRRCRRTSSGRCPISCPSFPTFGCRSSSRTSHTGPCPCSSTSSTSTTSSRNTAYTRPRRSRSATSRRATRWRVT